MSKNVGIGVLIILVSLFGFIFLSNKQSTPESSSLKNNQPTADTATSVTPITDVKASYAIFTNGTFRVFTAPMYHNLSPDVFINSSNPNIVQVKKEGITWKDFFETLPFTLGKDCLITGTKQTFCTNSTHTLKFYLNAKLDPEALARQLNNGDQLLVSYGVKNDSEVENQLQLIPKIK